MIDFLNKRIDFKEIYRRITHPEIADIAYVSMFGGIWISFGNILIGNLIWCVTNPILIYHNRQIKQVQQARMFSWFFIIALIGVINGITGRY